MLSPPTTNTSPNWTISPGLPLTLSTLITSSAATRYCLPPVLMTANIAFGPRVRCVRTGFLPSRLKAFTALIARTACGTPRLPHPSRLGRGRRLERQVGASRLAGDAYGGGGRKCQGNGTFRHFGSSEQRPDLPTRVDFPI